MTKNLKISIYEKRDETFQVSYINPLDLKRKRKSFLSKKEAQDYQSHIQSQFIKGLLLPRDKILVGDLINRFITRYPDSPMRYTKSTFKSFCEYFNHFPISKLTKEPLEKWFTHLKESKQYQEKTLSKIKCQHNHFFKWLMDEELIQANPLDKFKFRQTLPPKRSRIILSKEEVNTLIKELREYDLAYLYTMIYTIVHTGCRRGEILKLKWEDVDFSNGVLNFRNTKNGSDRQIRLSLPLQSHLLTIPRRSEFVISTEEGKPPPKNGLNKYMKEFKKQSSLKKDWKPHDLRHTFAFNFLRSGREMYQLKAILGHKTIGMTVDLYGNLSAGDVENPSPFDC